MSFALNSQCPDRPNILSLKTINVFIHYVNALPQVYYRLGLVTKEEIEFVQQPHLSTPRAEMEVFVDCMCDGTPEKDLHDYFCNI